MKQLRYAVILLSFLLPCITVHAQTAADPATIESTLAAKRLAEYRQKFWDSLPAPVSWTNDFIWLFTPEQRDYLDSLVIDFEKKTSAEIAIVTLDTFCTAIENFDALATHFGQSWGVGKKDINNGIVICIAPVYRKLRISNGTGIEKYLTDAETQAIIDVYMIPSFKVGKYFEGTANGLLQIITILNGRLKHQTTGQ